jgi:hypothetical protein
LGAELSIATRKDPIRDPQAGRTVTGKILGRKKFN